MKWSWMLLSGVSAVSLLVGRLACAQDDQAAPPAAATVDPAAPAPGPDTASDTAAGTGPTDDGASFQTFYDSLSNQGTWIQSSDYGYVWQPSVTNPNWAPYTEGHWDYTDDGWTWESDEPFGWAVYHYGRWANLDGTGWVWVPGYTWAPAWVSWRYGEDYAGWAPLPPDSMLGVDYFGDGYDADNGYHIGGDCDDFYGIGAGCYIFLPARCLGYRHYHGYYADRRGNYDRINHTRNVTDMNVTHRGSTGTTAGGRGRTVTTGGPRLAQVNAVSATPIERLRLVRTGQPGTTPSAPGTLAVYAPHIRSGNAQAPAHVAGTIPGAHVNRGTDLARPLAVNARLAPAPATEAEIAAAHESAAHAPSSAKVVTNAAAVSPAPRAPLTSYHPVTSLPARSPVAPAPTIYGAVGEPRSSEPPGVISHGPTMRTYPAPSTGGFGVPGQTAPSRPESPGAIYPNGSAPSYYAPRSREPVMPMETTPGFREPGAIVEPGTHVFSRPPAPVMDSAPAAEGLPPRPSTGEASSPMRTAPAASSSRGGGGRAASNTSSTPSSGGSTGSATSSSTGGNGRGH